MEWDEHLPPCFSRHGGDFAGDPVAEQHAFNWLERLRLHRTTWRHAERQIREFLADAGTGRERMEEQLARARLRIAPWLEQGASP